MKSLRNILFRSRSSPVKLLNSWDLKTNIYDSSNVPLEFSRNTVSTILDHEKIVRNLPANGIRFLGSRCVYNQVKGSSENLATSPWTASNGGTGVAPTITGNYTSGPLAGMTASRVQCNRGGGTTTGDWSYALQTGFNIRPKDVTISLWLRSTDGTSNYNVMVGTGNGGSNLKIFAVTGTWQRFSYTDPSSPNDEIRIGCRSVSGSNTSDFLVSGVQVEIVENQTNQNPSEYVSFGILSSPYYGAGADGLKYFSTANGNTVTSNVVTEAAGSAIAETSMFGYLAEESSTNLCLQSANSFNLWTLISTPTHTTASAYFGSLTFSLIDDTSAAALQGYKQTITFTSTAQKAVSLFIKRGTSTSSVIRLRDTTASADRLLVTITWSGETPVVTFTTGTGQSVSSGETISIISLKDNFFRLVFLTTSVTHTNTNELQIYPATDSSLAVGATGNVLISGVQVEEKLLSTTYIPTSTVTVTRDADILSFSNSTLSKLGGFYCEFIPSVWKNTSVLQNNVKLFYGTDKIEFTQTSLQFNDIGSNLAHVSTTSNLNTASVNKIYSGWGKGVSTVSMNGTGSDKSFSNSFEITPTSYFLSGNGSLKNVKLYSNRIKLASANTLTT